MTKNIKNDDDIFGIKIARIQESQALRKITEWGLKKESRYVCFCNSHTVYEVNRNKKIKKVINEADLILPDGFPVVLGMKINGQKKAKRIAGPDMMLRVCEAAAKTSQSIFLYGSDCKTIDKLKNNLETKYPELKIVGTLSPPFRDLSKIEKEKIQNKILKANPNFVFVGLGFPKQEMWMHENKENMNAVMLGVGAAFDFYAGNKKRAPKFIQDIGMEWFWRFLHEPKRLFLRYTRANSYICLKLIRIFFQKYFVRNYY